MFAQVMIVSFKIHFTTSFHIRLFDHEFSAGIIPSSCVFRLFHDDLFAFKLFSKLEIAETNISRLVARSIQLTSSRSPVTILCVAINVKFTLETVISNIYITKLIIAAVSTTFQ